MITRNIALITSKIMIFLLSSSTWAWVDKTVTTLTALCDLMFDELKINKVLVIAPLRVARDLLLQKSFRENHLTKRKMENQGQLPQYYVEDAHEPIIDREIFQQVQELIRKQQKFSPKKSCDTVYPFRSVITCGCCGKNYRRKTTVTGVVWICATYNNRGKKFCPTSKQIPEDTLCKACCDALKIDKFDEVLFQKQVEKILVPEPNLLTFIFHDGHEETVRWTDRSRSESWTSEMREKAAQNTREKRWKSCQK